MTEVTESSLLSHTSEKRKGKERRNSCCMEKVGTDILRVYSSMTKNSTSSKKACAFLKILVLDKTETLFLFS